MILFKSLLPGCVALALCGGVCAESPVIEKKLASLVGEDGLSEALDLFTVDKEKMLASVREHVASHPDGPFFSLGGAFEGTVDITKDDIDAIISDKPFFMIAASVHGGWCNTKALEMANAEEADKSPHYLFGRDENGELNGYVASAKTVVYMLDQLKVIDEAACWERHPLCWAR